MKTSFYNFLALWVLPGLVAGLVFLAIVLVTGALATTVWAMPDAIAQTMGIAAPAGYGFALVPVLIGIVVHLALSVVLGVIFTAFARWRHLHGWVLVVAAVLFVSVETFTALWVVMHNLLPAATFQFFLAAVPWWGSVLGHYMYAFILALLLILNPVAASWKSQKPSTPLEARG
jgi:hypothetical protein